MPILLANGPRHWRRAVRRRCLLSRAVVPHALNGDQQAELKGAAQELPARVGIDWSNWNWKKVGDFFAGLSDQHQEVKCRCRTVTVQTW